MVEWKVVPSLATARPVRAKRSAQTAGQVPRPEHVTEKHTPGDERRSGVP